MELFRLAGAYYGIDLLATAFTLIGIYYLGEKRHEGFLLTLCGNILWLLFGLITQSIGILIANLCIALLNIRGYYKWKAGSSS